MRRKFSTESQTHRECRNQIQGASGGLIHYELILMYAVGFHPKDVIREFGYSRSSAYRFHRIYRDARKEARNRLSRRISVSPDRETRANKLGELRKRKKRSQDENKAKSFIRLEDGSYAEF